MTVIEQENTVFHKILRREIPAKIVFEDDLLLAFRDTNPVAPTHILIVPKKTIPSLREAGDADEQLLGHVFLVARQIAEHEGIAEEGYRLVLNVGKFGGQMVMQFHLHLLGGRPLSWPPG